MRKVRGAAAICLAALLAGAGTIPPLSARQPPAEKWPHLSPEGFGLRVAGGRLNHAPWDYRPRAAAGAESHLQVRFLPGHRTGERIDIWVPKGAARDARLPCIVLFYGGGWGGKVAGGLHKDVLDLVRRDYVVAMPDYLLQAREPVPAAIWDGAHAIRWLRAHAAEYRIDPERIGVWGFSAGGWLVQYLAPSDSATRHRVTVKRNRRKRVEFQVPMLQPHPPLADQPLRVQAVVSDWGCGKLADQRVGERNRDWFGPDDPPLLTCHNVKDVIPPGPLLYRQAGAIVEICHLDVRNTHVPNRDTPAVGKDGRPTTWHGRVFEFFDEYVKHPRRATAPEAVPAGGPIAGPAAVTLRSVHADAAIHFTTDGAEPTRKSPAYSGPVTLRPGQTLRAVAIKPPLKPSAVASFSYRKAGRPAPVIRTRQGHFVARVGRPFQVRFEADGEDVEWHICGRAGNVIDRKVNPPRLVRWLEMDRQTGVLSGTPESPGYAVILVTAAVRDGKQVLTDARRVVVTVAK